MPICEFSAQTGSRSSLFMNKQGKRVDYYNLHILSTYLLFHKQQYMIRVKLLYKWS
ncbi:hypothetical protein Hanom_Chr04g00295171 [Helianthus anomalus]